MQTSKDMDIQSLKIDLIHWLTELKDTAVLEKINAIKEETDGLTESQHAELERRLEKYSKGEMNFKSWEDAKESIRERSKNAL